MTWILIPPPRKGTEGWNGGTGEITSIPISGVLFLHLYQLHGIFCFSGQKGIDYAQSGPQRPLTYHRRGHLPRFRDPSPCHLWGCPQRLNRKIGTKSVRIRETVVE